MGGGSVALDMAPGLTLYRRRAQPGPSPRRSRPRPGGAGDPRQGPVGTKVGPAENVEVLVPLIETPEHIKAAQTATREVNAPYLTVMLEGKYTDAYLTKAGKDAPSSPTTT